MYVYVLIACTRVNSVFGMCVNVCMCMRVCLRVTSGLWVNAYGQIFFFSESVSVACLTAVRGSGASPLRGLRFILKKREMRERECVCVCVCVCVCERTAGL